MKKISRKIVSIVLVIVMVMFNLPASVFAATRPSVSMGRPSASSVNVGGTVSYLITYFNYDNINLSESYINLNGFTANVSVSGSGDTRTVTLSNIQGTAGSKSIAIKAASAENSYDITLATPNSIAFTLNSSSTNTNTDTNTNTNTPVTTVAIDRTRPSISIGTPSASSINVGGTVSYVITVGDNVGVAGINISASTINLNGFTANVSVSGSGNTRTITLSNIQGTAGSKSIALKSGVVSDAAGNTTLATPNSFSFTLNASNTNTPVTGASDRVRPSISIGRPSVESVYAGGTVSYVVTFGDNVGIANVNIASDYIVLSGFTADISVTGSGNTRTITLTNIQGSVGGNKKIALKARSVEDTAGNGSLATPYSFDFSILANQGNAGTTTSATTTNKADNEPYTGVASLPVLPIMGSVAGILTVAGVVVTKKIYG